MGITQKAPLASTFGDAIGSPAWKSKPSWYQISSADRMIAPENQERMAARIAPREDRHPRCQPRVTGLASEGSSGADRRRPPWPPPTSAAQDAAAGPPAAAAGQRRGQVEAAVGHGRTAEVAAADRPGETEQAIEHPSSTPIIRSHWSSKASNERPRRRTTAPRGARRTRARRAAGGTRRARSFPARYA